MNLATTTTVLCPSVRPVVRPVVVVRPLSVRPVVRLNITCKQTAAGSHPTRGLGEVPATTPTKNKRPYIHTYNPSNG